MVKCVMVLLYWLKCGKSWNLAKIHKYCRRHFVCLWSAKQIKWKKERKLDTWLKWILPLSFFFFKYCFSACFFVFRLVLARNHVQMAGLAKHPPIQRIAAMFIWFRRELNDADLQETQRTGRFSVPVCCQWVCIGHCLLINCLPRICSSSRGRSAQGIPQCSCQYRLLLEWLNGCRHCTSERTSFVGMLEGRKHRLGT